MKRWIYIVALFWCLPSWATWTMVQHPNTGSCVAGTTCTLTVTSTGAGHVILVWAFMPTSTPFTNTISSLTCGGSFTIDANSDISNSTIGGAQQIAYTLNSTSGTTSCVVNFTTATNSNAIVSMAEYSFTGSSAAFDNSGNLLNPSGANPAGVTLTLSGSNDVIYQANTPDASCSAISAPYTNPADFPGGWGLGGSINTASGTAPSWTCGAGVDIMSAVAIKEISSGVPVGQFPRVN